MGTSGVVERDVDPWREARLPAKQRASPSAARGEVRGPTGTGETESQLPEKPGHVRTCPCASAGPLMSHVVGLAVALPGSTSPEFGHV